MKNIVSSGKEALANMARSAFATIIYPTRPGNWYLSKKYDSFASFIKKQSDDNSPMDKMPFLKATRESEDSRPKFLLDNGSTATLDTVTLKPDPDKIKDLDHKVGKDIHVIYVRGRGENFEATTYREASEDAANLGITAHLFNLPGMQDSTGKMGCFNDGINAVIAQVKRLTKEGVAPENIILKGNCLGAWMAGGAQDELSKQNIMVRTVRSNTFRSIEEVIVAHTPTVLQPMVRRFSALVKPLGWSYDAEEKNLVNGPFNLMVNRPGDGILKDQALLAPALTKRRNDLGIPQEELYVEGYEQSQKLFDEYGSNMYKKAGAKGDPHALKFNDLVWHDNGKERGGQELFAEYIERSSAWINSAHYQKPTEKKEPSFAETKHSQLTKLQQREAQKFCSEVQIITKAGHALEARESEVSIKPSLNSPRQLGHTRT